MTVLPPAIINAELNNELNNELSKLECISTGKVRNRYWINDNLHLSVTSDRISIFDFVINALVPKKGEVLNALNVFWATGPLADICQHDIVAYGSNIDSYLPESLRGEPTLQKTAVVARTLTMLPVEAIVRMCLTGSGWKAYQYDQTVCGHRLPAGLQNGAELPCPLFTPTTKAEVGHDEHITADSVAEKYGVTPERLSLQLAAIGRAYAKRRGIMLADTKFEFGRDKAGNLVLGDERLTPDSSRFWDLKAWNKAQDAGNVPQAFDKEFVRQWGKGIGIHKLKPEIKSDVDWVHTQTVPDEVIAQTTRLYRYIFWRLTGVKLEFFQHQQMLATALPSLTIHVLLGSRSDLEQASCGYKWLQLQPHVTSYIHFVSCHRNDAELSSFIAAGNLDNADVIIAGGGMAAALPGIVKAKLARWGKYPPVIGVAFEGKTADESHAARLSISQLPGQPVELDQNGEAYFGSTGFSAACFAAAKHEFLPKIPGKKPAEFFVHSQLC